MDLGHLLRWKRKWAIIHNTAPLKTSIRWSLLSLLLIALEQAAPLGGHSSLSLYTQIYIKDLSVYQLLPLRIHIQPLVEVAWAPVTFPASLMPDHASPLSLSLSRCVSDMGELLLSREGYTSYLSVPQDLKVHPGDDVVLTCSASSSEEPSYSWLKEVRRLQELSSLRFSESCLSLTDVLPLHFWCDLFFILTFPPLFFQSLQVSVGFVQVFFQLSRLLQHVPVSLTDSLQPLVSPRLSPLRPPPQKKCSVFKWPVGLGPPLAGDCSLPTYRGLIV